MLRAHQHRLALCTLALMAAVTESSCRKATRDLRVVRAGQETHLLALVGEPPYPGDAALERVEAQGGAIAYRFSDGGRLTLTPAGSASSVKTGHFSVHFAAPGLSEEHRRERERLLLQRVAARDTIDVWLRPEPPPDRLFSPDEIARWTARSLALAGLLLVVAAMRKRISWPATMRRLALLGSIGLTVAWTWISDDAHISFRYVKHLLAGEGLVFNPGERVQGFTHPLWLALLTPGQALMHPYAWVMLLSALLSALLVMLLWRWRIEEGDSGPGALAATGLLFTSNLFLTFQSGGLENPLTHLLLVTLARLVWQLHRSPEHPSSRWLMPLGAALVLTRPDNLLVAGPMVLAGLTRPKSHTASLNGTFWSTLGLFAWYGFATLYYGFPLPNTWYAKTGTTETSATLEAGLLYLADTLRHEPLLCLGAIIGLLAALTGKGSAGPGRRPARFAAVGALLHIAYVVSIGGDYMRGRFLLAPLLVGTLLLTDRMTLKSKTGAIAVPGVIALSLLWTLAAPRSAAGPIVDERAFHPEMRLPQLIFRTPREEPTLRGNGVALSTSLAARAFLDGPNHAWLDGYGLTDAFIARCPTKAHQRAGHLERMVPKAYLAARGDVRLVPDGEQRLRTGDPSLASELAALEVPWPNAEAQRAHEELHLLTRGPLLDPSRLRLIPRHLLRRSIPVAPSDAVPFTHFDGQTAGN